MAVEKYADVDFATSYGQIAQEVVSQYVLSVIDLTYTVDGDNVVVSMMDNSNGLDLGDKAYFTSLVEDVTVANGANITIQINVSEAGAVFVENLATGTSLPIILRNASNLGEYKLAVCSNASYSNGVLTITFNCAI